MPPDNKRKTALDGAELTLLMARLATDGWTSVCPSALEFLTKWLLVDLCMNAMVCCLSYSNSSCCENSLFPGIYSWNKNPYVLNFLSYLVMFHGEMSVLVNRRSLVLMLSWWHRCWDGQCQNSRFLYTSVWHICWSLRKWLLCWAAPSGKLER